MLVNPLSMVSVPNRGVSVTTLAVHSTVNRLSNAGCVAIAPAMNEAIESVVSSAVAVNDMDVLSSVRR